jgi:hypothetical protein
VNLKGIREMPTSAEPLPLLRQRAANAWWDLRASFAGYCNASAWRLARDNPVDWRCARRSGHLGLHRHGAFRWDDTGRLYRDVISEPVLYQPWSRYPVSSVRQARLAADPDARRLAAEAITTAARLTVSARVQVARPASRPARVGAVVRPHLPIARPASQQPVAVTAPNTPHWRSAAGSARARAVAIANRRLGVGQRLAIRPPQPEQCETQPGDIGQDRYGAA